jgi:hypothetical protein
MRRVYYFFASLATSLLLFSYAPASENGKTGSSGAPGEGTCTSCHGGGAGGSVSLTSNIPASGFVPGATYNMSVTVSQTGQPLFGIGLESLTAANLQAGTLSAGSGTQVQVKTGRQNLIHTLGGGASANSKTFSFNWTAPATAAGNVTFYYAGLAANGNGVEDAGDNTYAGSQVFSPQAAAAVVTLNCPPALTMAAAQGATSAVVNYTAPVGTSTCTTGSVTTSKSSGLASGSAFPVGTSSVCYTATDGCGSTQNCCFNVTVTAPAAAVLTLNCPTDIAVTAAAGATTAVATYTAPVGTSTCATGTVTTTKTSGLASGAAFPIGTNAVCYTATDACGNTKNCCFNVVVTAAAASVITMNCPTNISLVAAAGATSSVATYTAPVGTSTCATGTVTTSKSSGLASGAAFPIGVNSVCYTATDGCGTTKNCCFNVTVTSAAPTVLTLNCPTNITVVAATGATTAVANYTAPVGTSTCTTGSVTTTKTSGLASGTAFPIGTNAVCYTATDACGNTKNCCFNVIVNAAVTGGGTSTTCNKIKIQDDDNSVKIYGLPRVNNISVAVKITNTRTNAVTFQCTNCSANKGTLKIKNIPLGSYSVMVSLTQSGVALCQKTGTVFVEEEEDDFSSTTHSLMGNTNSSISNTVNKETAAELADMIILYAQPSGIAKTAKTFGLFPNPAADVVTIDVKRFKGQAVNILIVNQLGQVVKNQLVQEATNSPVSVNLENIVDGFYTVTLLSNGERKANKLVVKKDR